MFAKVSVRTILKALRNILIILYVPLFYFLRAPTFPGTPLPDHEQAKIDQRQLELHVKTLTSLTPTRSYKNEESLKKAQDYIFEKFTDMGFKPELQRVDGDNKIYQNVIARYGDANSKDLIVIGAHYDAAGPVNPGADDNASGVAGLIELAREFQIKKPKLNTPVEFVAYTLEEPPFFASKEMGSVYHADRLKGQGTNVKFMISLEMIGYFSEKSFSQSYYPALLYLFYPWSGNFIGVVSVPGDRAPQRILKAAMAANSDISVYSITAPASLPGVDFSDHRSYWTYEWPAFMITDTAFLRNNQYHQPGDTPDRLDYTKMAEVIKGTYAGILALDVKP